MAWLPGQLHKLKSLRSLSISATNLNFGRLFKGLGKVRSLRTAFINGCKEVKEELPDDVMAPLANHTGTATGFQIVDCSDKGPYYCMTATCRCFVREELLLFLQFAMWSPC